MDSQSSLGVVIPCHKPYILFLRDCLDSIEFQTVKPNKVVVVCSSSKPEDIPPDYRKYSFDCEIITREEEYNQAQNRNKGAKYIQTDYVTFFDADDVMHPQRIELIRKYMADTDILFHSFRVDMPLFSFIRTPIVYKDELMRAPTGCVVFRPKWDAPLHHAQVTVRKDIFDKVTFREDECYKRREDSLFCGDVVALGVRNTFIAEPLSWYRLTH